MYIRDIRGKEARKPGNFSLLSYLVAFGSGLFVCFLDKKSLIVPEHSIAPYLSFQLYHHWTHRRQTLTVYGTAPV